MADTSNLTNFLGDIADAIRTKKSTTEQIPAENFDQEILSIETGIDTSDATATAEEVRMGKTAYVKGEKITGTLEYAINSSNPITNGRENVTDTGDNIQVLRGYGKALLLGADQDFETKIPYADVATMGNITADKIVKGNTIFGIEGVAETGGSGDIKLFETEEEMQADTNAKEGDLAIVYRNEIQNATVDSQFQTAKFPETVVLDTAITDYVEVRYRAVDDSVMFGCFGQLDSSMFMMDCYSETGEVRIQYTSSDGITYTRTDDTGNPVDFGTEIYYEMTEMWNDAIGKFIQIGGSTFEGLYKYVLNVPINSFKLREQHSANYNLTYTQNNPGLDKIYTGEEVFTGEDVGNKIREILKNEIRGAMFLSKDMSILYLVPTQFQNLYVYNNKLEPLVFNSADKVADIVYYKYTLSDMQREEITMTKSELGILDDGGVVTNLPDDSYYMLGIVNSTGTYIRWTVSSVSYYQIYTVGTGTEIEYDDRYIIADTQLTLNNANQLLPGKIAYGKNGVVTGDGSIWNEIPTSVLAGCYNFPNVYTSGGYTVYGVHNDYKYYINRAKSTVPTRRLVYFKKDNDVDISSVDAIGIDATNIEIYPREISGFSSDKSIYFNGLKVYDTATNELLKTYDGYAVIGNDRNTSRVYYYNKSSTDVFQIYEVDLDDYENPREFYSVPYGFTKNDTYVKIKSNSTAKVQGEDTICAMHLTAGSAYNGSTYDVLDVILIFNMTKGTIHQAYSRTATTNSYSAGSLDSLWTDSKVGIQLYERDGTKKRRSVLYDYATNTSTVSTDSDTVWYISGTPAGFEQDGYAYFPDKTKRYPMITFDGEDWSNVILDENGTVLANTTSSYSVYSAGDQMIFYINNKYYRLKSMNVDEANTTTNWVIDTSVDYYLRGTYNNANLPDCLSVSIDKKYVTKLYDDGSFDILSTLYGRVKLDKLILTDVDAYDICCIYISHATSNDSNISTYPTILTRYGNTISPAEYDTAINTVDEILGEEV